MDSNTKILFEKILGLSIEDSIAIGNAEREYEKLLSDEHEEVIRFAAAHRWKSSSAKRGKELRGIIQELKSKKKN